MERTYRLVGDLLNLSCDVIFVDTSSAYLEHDVPDPRIKDDLAGWLLHRIVWVADSRFNSLDNRTYLGAGTGSYVLAERVRGGSRQDKAALSRAGRYHHVAGNLEVKEVRVKEGASGQ